MAYAERAPDLRPRARPDLVGVTAEEPPVAPHFAFVKTPAWDQADADVHEGFEELLAFLGDQVETVDLDDLLENSVEQHRAIMETDLARSFGREYAGGRDRLSPQLCEMIERGQRCQALDYLDALEGIEPLRGALAEMLLEYDAIITPAATGEAPVGLESTGNPVFCTPWTLAGLPSISLPLLGGANDMPVGVQLVAAKGDDARLLRTARWLAVKVAE